MRFYKNLFCLSVFTMFLEERTTPASMLKCVWGHYKCIWFILCIFRQDDLLPWHFDCISHIYNNVNIHLRNAYSFWCNTFVSKCTPERYMVKQCMYRPLLLSVILQNKFSRDLLFSVYIRCKVMKLLGIVGFLIY